MSLSRWARSSRLLNREKSKETDTGHFSTVHISNPVTHRRGDISSVLANYETGSQDGSPVNEIRSMGVSQPLSVHFEDIPVPSKLRFVDSSPNEAFDSRRPVNPVPKPPRNPSPFPDRESDTAPNGTPPSAPYGLCNGADASTPRGDVVSLGYDARYNHSPPFSTRGHSSSSSYPSEGLRSSLDHCLSPPQNTWAEGFVSELSRYSLYPARDTLSNSPTSLHSERAPHGEGRQCLTEEPTAAGGTPGPDVGAIGNNCNTQLSHSDFPSHGYWQGPDEQKGAYRCSNLVDVIYEETQRLPLSQESTPCMLDGHGSSTLAVQGSSSELQSSAQNESLKDYFLCKPVSNTGSMDRLRPSTERGTAYTSRAHQHLHGNPYFNTMPASVSRKRYRREDLNCSTPSPSDAQIDGTQPPNASESLSTIVRQPHSFKLAKWFKKICIRTKVRFDNAIRLEPSSATHGRKKSIFRRSLRPKKRGRAKKSKWSKSKSKPAKSRQLSPSLTRRVIRDGSGQGEGKARRFLRSLETRKSMQLPAQDGVEGSNAGHRRVHSCPRDFPWSP
ncbi:hypothetical protein GGR53DRAFT_507975 [Hypoxylon sp. FL1150]|nr:hypothetical protein GGR53DRAFT_507975 [Hypoxylon sp. FL1150]